MGLDSVPTSMRPVSFPTEAADAAVEACERVAGLLEEHLRARPLLIAQARDAWEGTYRDEFDTASADRMAAVADFKQSLRFRAGRIRDAIDEAADENRQRAARRDDHLAAQRAQQRLVGG